MRISDAFLQELKSRADIEEIISQYVTLKRAGSNMIGVCPFHSEKTPSFTVFKNTQNFYCFGCGAGGDVITFIMRMENLDYISAVDRLASRVGMQMPEDDGEYRPKIDKNRFFEMNKCAARFFHTCLMAKEDAHALEYITQRGLTLSTIKRFGLGYADTSWDSLTGYLMKNGYSREEMKLAFLAGEGKSGKVFDYFRGRIIFPIFDISGNVIAFGGRIITDGMPKYLNSSDTPVFKKSRNLYALNIAKDCGHPFILCEGYMDDISLQQAGFHSAVATLGTAITPDQAKIMSRYSGTVYICYDSDEAGTKAAKKAMGLLDEAGANVRIIKMNGAKDPDEYIKKFGKSAFEKLLQSSAGRIEYSFEVIAAKYNVEIPEQKVAFISEICTMLSEVHSEVEREIYIQKAAVMCGIAPDIIKNEADRTRKKTIREKNKRDLEEKINKTMGYGDRINSDKTKFLAAAAKEENILGILLLRPEYLDSDIRNSLKSEMFLCTFNRREYEEILEHGADISRLSAVFTPEEVGKITQFTVARSALTDNGKSVLFELIDALKVQYKKSNVIDDVDGLLKRIDELRKEKK